MPWSWLFHCVFKSIADAEVDNPAPAAAPVEEERLRRASCEEDLIIHPSAASEATAEDMHKWMADEDRAREELFKKPLPAPPRTFSRAVPGAHVGFQLARTACQQIYCCGACGAWLARPQDTVPSVERVCDMSFDDSAVTVCVTSADVKDARRRDIETSNGWIYSARDVRCRSCDAFLGVKLHTMRQKRSAVPSPAHSRLLEQLLIEAQGLRASPPRACSSAYSTWRRQQERETGGTEVLDGPSRSTTSGSASREEDFDDFDFDDDDDDDDSVVSAELATEADPRHVSLRLSAPSQAATTTRPAPTATATTAAPGAPPAPLLSAALLSDVKVDQVLLGLRYLRLLDAHTDRALAPLVPLLCQQCHRTLSYTDQLLCTRRRWGFGRSMPQPACFMNSLVLDHVQVRDAYEGTLAISPDLSPPPISSDLHLSPMIFPDLP